LNVAILHPAFSTFGGAEVVALNQARCLRDHGFSVRVITSKIDGDGWSEKLRGFRIDALAGAAWPLRLNRHASILRQAQELSAVLADADVAIAHNYPMSQALALANTRARKIWYCNEPNRQLHLDTANPTIAARVANHARPETEAERSFLAERRIQRSPLRILRRPAPRESDRDVAAVRRLDVVCVNSSFTERLATSTYGARDYRVVYPLMELPAPRARRSGLARNALSILVHSRLEPPKNIDTIVRGFARFGQRGASGARLHIVGQGTSRSFLEQLVAQLGIRERVNFYGFLPRAELESIYAACEVFALAPIDEPFGMVFVEAAVRGLLLLCPDHGGPFEVVDRGRLGQACDAFSPASIADAFQRISEL
jgi:glycosyltransferase involved in cell wall biosynthesis